MNIWLLQTGEPLPIYNIRKMRTALVAEKLLERGHNIYWWASAFEHQQKKWVANCDRDFQLTPKFIIRVLRGCGYRANISLARYFDHWLVALKFKHQALKKPKPDIIVASMPDHLLAYESARYALKNRIPFIVDIRDLWPDIFLYHLKNMGLHALGKLVLKIDFARLKFLLNSSNSLVAVSKGYLNFVLNKIERSETPLDKVLYLGYKSNKAKSNVYDDKSASTPDWIKGREDQKIFVFIGTFGVSYELELILEAVKYFDNLKRNDICFILAGKGDKYNIIKKKAAGLDNVVLPAWINEKEINALLNISYAGLVPCRSVENTIPNKIFEYLSIGLPLINSLEGEMAGLVHQHGLGLNYKPGDLEGLCRCIEQLVADRRLRDKMSKNALDFFERYGDADKIYDEYAKHIERVAKSCRITV